MWTRISGFFFKGLFTLLPLFVTIWLTFFMFNFFDGILGGVMNVVAGKHVPGLGFVASILLIFITGILVTYIVGERIFKLGEWLLFRLPIIKNIYASAKQVNDVLFMQGETKGYRKACLVEYPRKGIYSIGFVTSEVADEIKKKADNKKMVNIFIANTPTPATGFLIMMPAGSVKLLNMRLDDAFKYVVSGGVLKPRK
jgi:uncharacterized membrane protein